ncbi:MAG: adenylate/guanylate cyclase domain-containing protein [Polyangiaceae bacterium]
MARLILATAEGIQAVELRPQNSLGRHPNNSIQLLDKIVSKEHCLIEQRGEAFVLRDLGSLNGTFINGERVRGEQGLRHGDEISLGSTRARYDDGKNPVNFPMPSVGPGAVSAPQGTIPLGPRSGQGAPVVSMPPPTSQGRQSYGGVNPALTPIGSPSQGHAPPHGHGAPPSSMRNPMGQPSPQAHGQGQSGGHMGGQQQPQHFVPPGPPLPQGHPGTQPYRQAPPIIQQAKPAPSRPMTLAGTRVDMLDSARAIERQIQATAKGFAPFDQVAQDAAQLRLDYERLRISWELAREIAMERDLDALLEKVLRSLFKFVKADRGVILLKESDGSLQPRAAQRRDGTQGPIEVSSTILNHVVTEKAAVLTHDASQDFASAKGKSMILNRISSAMVVPLVHESEVLGALWLDSPALAQFQQKDLEVVTSVVNQATMFIENTLLARKIEQEIVMRERFSRLLSPNVAERVVSGALEIKKGGVRVAEATVFNSDIRGFTSMSEGTSAEEMVELINEYFELMVETIFKFEGTLDKFMGDGIMAFWGAPQLHAEDAVRSVQCALEQMEVLGRFNRRQIEKNAPPLAIGIGIHTGGLVAGYVGSSKSLSYTVIGDTANTSARLCGIAAAGQIIVSESTLARLGNRFEYEELKPAALKGKEKPLRIFNILREKSEEDTELPGKLPVPLPPPSTP